MKYQVKNSHLSTNLGQGWTAVHQSAKNSSKFNSKFQVVIFNNQPFQIVEKWERSFSRLELLENYAQGCVAKFTHIFAFGLSSSECEAAEKWANHFFKSKETIHCMVYVGKGDCPLTPGRIIERYNHPKIRSHAS